MANKNMKAKINVEFTEATSRQSIESGESVNTLFGKIKKFFSDLKSVAFSGSYNDLSNKPTIPTKTSQLTNDSGYKTTDSNTTYNLSKSGTNIVLTGSDGSKTSVDDNNTTYGVATSAALGLVKSGTDITVDTSGNVSVNDDSHNHVISNIDGLQTVLDSKAASSHTHSYLPLSGGSLTGSIKTNIGGRNGEAISFYAGDGNGTGMVIGAGGRTIIGSGESAQALRNTLGTAASDEVIENMHIASDNSVYIHVGCQTVADRKTFTFKPDGSLTAAAFNGNLNGNATSASKLQTARTINGTSFDGTGNITTANWGTARTITIGNTSRSVNGGGNVSWSLSDIGAAATSHSHNYAGSSSAGGTAYSAATLTRDDRMTYGWNGVNYFNFSGKAGSAAKVNDCPTSNWWHIMRFNHANAQGYYTDLAIPFNEPSICYKRICAGSVQDNGWVKVLDTANYTAYTVTRAGSGASGTWGISVTGSSGSCSGNSATASALTTSAGSATQPVYFSGGKPVACTYTLGKSVPSNAVFTDTTYGDATTSTHGLMTAAMVTKLNGIAAGANAYSLPLASSSTRGGVKIGYTANGKNYPVQLSNEQMYVNVPWTDTDTTYSNFKGATTSAAGGAGLVPAPTIGAANRYLRSDGTWQVPPDTNTTYSALKNPYALTLQFNGTTNKTYDGSSAQTLNITPAAIGASASNHNHNGAYVYDKANVSAGTMNMAASFRNAMGMIQLSGTDATINPNGQTGWHHFINVSYSEQSGSNMWQTQIANKAGTTDLWVRSRCGGAIADGTAWAAPWTRILTGTNWKNVVTLSALGAAASSHTHSYLPLSGGVMTGNIYFDSGSSGIYITKENTGLKLHYQGGYLNVYSYGFELCDAPGNIISSNGSNAEINLCPIKRQGSSGVTYGTIKLDGNVSISGTVSGFTTTAGIVLNNAKYIRAKNTSGTIYDICGVGSNNAVRLGNNSVVTRLYGSSIYLKDTSTSVSSDENIKKDFVSFDERYDKFFDGLKPCGFKYIYGKSGRTHSGFKAQQVEQALLDSGLTNYDFAVIDKMQIKCREQEEDENSNLIDVPNSYDNYLLDKGINVEYSLRYSEFIGLLVDQLQKSKTRIKNLEEEVKLIKEVVS